MSELRLAVVGAGRLGTLLSSALPADGPFGRGFRGVTSEGVPYDVVLLCVPDAEIASAAAHIRPGPLVGHCSGATGLGVLRPHEGFVLHPLMTVTREGGDLAGAGCTIAGTTDHARRTAHQLARTLGMVPTELAEADRALYHAAAALASNYLVALEASAERLMTEVGVDRELLVPLVRATVENWARYGADRALTGPVARGDDQTVARQRTAVAERAPDLLPAFDALTEVTRRLSAREVAVR